MKKYPPRKHDKSKKIDKSGFPRFVLHHMPSERPTVWREIAGLLIRMI